MNFKFEYRYYNKYCLDNIAGQSIIIDNNFNNIEILYLDKMNRIINSLFVDISYLTKNKILNIIKNNKDIFNLNSYLYLEGNSKDIEQLFYFELNTLNRKIEGFNINLKNIDNKDASLLIKIFDDIANALLDDNVKIFLNDISIFK